MKNYKLQMGVLLSCFNNEHTVGKSINSIIKQNYPCKNLLIIDNGSTDNSWNTICTILKNDIQDNYIETQINNIDVYAIKNEFQTNDIGMLITAINTIWKDIDIIGLFKANEEYLAGKLLLCMDYIQDIYDYIGIIYNDYEKSQTPIYKESFSINELYNENPFGPSPFITKKAIESIGMVDPDGSLNDLWALITERFVAIHIPEILNKECIVNDKTGA